MYTLLILALLNSLPTSFAATVTPASTITSISSVQVVKATPATTLTTSAKTTASIWDWLESSLVDLSENVEEIGVRVVDSWWEDCVMMSERGWEIKVSEYSTTRLSYSVIGISWVDVRSHLWRRVMVFGAAVLLGLISLGSISLFDTTTFFSLEFEFPISMIGIANRSCWGIFSIYLTFTSSMNWSDHEKTKCNRMSTSMVAHSYGQVWKLVSFSSLSSSFPSRSVPIPTSSSYIILILSTMKIFTPLTAGLFCLLASVAAKTHGPLTEVEKAVCAKDGGKVFCCDHSLTGLSLSNTCAESASNIPRRTINDYQADIYTIDDDKVTSRKYHKKHENMKGQFCPKRKFDHGLVLISLPPRILKFGYWLIR